MKDTEEIAAAILDIFRGLKTGDDNGPFLVGLVGELGSGKTELVRCFVRILGEREELVRSVSFLGSTSYGRILHCDFYRVGDVQVMEDNWEWVFIEWPEADLAVDAVVNIELEEDEVAEDGFARIVKVFV